MVEWEAIMQDKIRSFVPRTSCRLRNEFALVIWNPLFWFQYLVFHCLDSSFSHPSVHNLYRSNLYFSPPFSLSFFHFKVLLNKWRWSTVCNRRQTQDFEKPSSATNTKCDAQAWCCAIPSKIQPVKGGDLWHRTVTYGQVQEEKTGAFWFAQLCHLSSQTRKLTCGLWWICPVLPTEEPTF